MDILSSSESEQAPEGWLQPGAYLFEIKFPWNIATFVCVFVYFYRTMALSG